MRSPVSIVLQVFREMFGKENMTGIATRHDPLRNVNSCAGEIGLIIYIRDWIDWAAVNTHAQFELRTALQFLADFEGALDRCFRIIREDEHHSVAGRQTGQLAFSLCGTELLRLSNNLIEFQHQLF